MVLIFKEFIIYSERKFGHERINSHPGSKLNTILWSRQNPLQFKSRTAVS